MTSTVVQTGRETDQPLDLTVHRLDEVASEFEAQVRAGGVDVGLGGDGLPGDRWKVGHQRVCFIVSEHRLELAVQIQSVAVVDRHGFSSIAGMQGEVGMVNGTKGVSRARRREVTSLRATPVGAGRRCPDGGPADTRQA